MATEQKTSGGVTRKFVIALAVIIILALGATGVFYYLRLYGPNVTDKQEYLYIRTGSNFQDVYKTIREQGIVKDSTTFMWAAHNKKYVNKVKPGRYKLKSGMSNRDLIYMLISGRQEPVKVALKNLRKKENFAGYISKKLEADSMSIISLLDSAGYQQKLGFTNDDIYTIVIPNTYEFYWNASPKKIMAQLYGAYKKFWTAERKQKAEALNLTPSKVSTLASIVDAEALHDGEMPAIAGLYLNRLKKGMKLQSDPTVIFAADDFTIHRVLNKQLAIVSPYNTYNVYGLPPGPIMMPSINAIDAVLNYEHNDHIYMCAKEDFSGYHNFAATEAQHKINADKFRKALNERHIMR